MSSWRSRNWARLKPAAFILPCLPVRAAQAPSAEGWLHEIKHDGYRLQIHVNSGRVRLYTMTGVDWTERFPLIEEAAGRLKVKSAIIDAEAVVCGKDGVTDFEALHARTREHEAFAYAFDLMMADGKDLRRLPLKDRKAMLRECTRRASHGMLYADHMEGDGATVFRHACKLGLEGIVSKKASSFYKSGRCTSWIKVKNATAPAAARIENGSWS
jgi:bifunctional non-homologous end joining protein LigD